MLITTERRIKMFFIFVVIWIVSDVFGYATGHGK